MRKAKENPKYKKTSSPISETLDVSTKKKRKSLASSEGSASQKLPQGAGVVPEDEAATDLLLLSEASSVHSPTPKKRSKMEVVEFSKEVAPSSHLQTISSAPSTLQTQKQHHLPFTFKDDRGVKLSTADFNESSAAAFAPSQFSARLEADFPKQSSSQVPASSVPLTPYKTQSAVLLPEPHSLTPSSLHGVHLGISSSVSEPQPPSHSAFASTFAMQPTQIELQPKLRQAPISPGYIHSSVVPQSPSFLTSSALPRHHYHQHHEFIQQRQPQQHLSSAATLPISFPSTSQRSSQLPSLETLIQQKLSQLTAFETVTYHLFRVLCPECSLSFYRTNQPSAGRPPCRIERLPPLLYSEFVVPEQPPLFGLPSFHNLPLSYTHTFPSEHSDL